MDDHFPEEHQAESLRNESPWYLSLRFLFVDLEDIPSCADTWRRCQVRLSPGAVPGEKEFQRRSTSPTGFPYLRWGKRIVSLEQ